MNDEPFFKTPLAEGGSISGVRGGETKLHDYNDLGIGHIKTQAGEKLATVNNFNSTVDSMLPDWMKK